MRWLVLLCVGCLGGTRTQYEWDDKRVLCSVSIDDITADANWDDIESELAYAAEHQTVALLHAHVPAETVSLAALDRVLDRADAEGLAYVTYRELAAGGPRRAGLAFCFDDQAIDAWYVQRERLAAHNAHVTFFATRYAAWQPEQHIKLAELAADGHDVQAHGVNHLNAIDYLARHPIEAYLTNEALPSIDVLQRDGYAIDAYAFPFGASNDALDAALLDYVRLVRVSPGSCPY